MSIEKAEAAQAAVETMLEAVAVDPGQQQLNTALLQAQSDLGEGVAIIDPQTQRFVYVNNVLCRMYGYSAAELLVLPSFFTLIVPEEQDAFRTRLAWRQQGQPTENHYEIAVRRKDGIRITIEVAVTQISGPNGPQLVALIRDITAHKQTEEALRQTHAALEQQVQERTAALAAMNERLTATLAEQQRITATLQESEARYRLLADHAADALRAGDVRLRSHIEHSPLAVIEWDQELRVVQWSSRAEQLFGWTAAEVVGKRRHEWQLVVGEDDARIQEAIEPFLTTAPPQPKNRWEVHQNRNYTKDGQILHCEWYNSFLYDEAGRFTSILSLVHDVTAREQAETARLQLAAIAESSDDAIISKSLDGIITSWNAAAERIFGYRAEEIVGQSILRLVPADRHEEEHELLRRLRRGERVDHLETVRRTKDGRLLDVSVTSSPLRDERGTIIGASKIARDITVRKRAEEALARAYADLQQIAYIAAHELQEPVRQVGLYTQKIAKCERGAFDSDTRTAMGFIVEGTQRMTTQLKDLLQYLEVDMSSAERIPTDCEVVLQRALDHVRPAITASGATVTHGPLPTLRANPAHLQLVFQELLDNALKFYDTASPRVHVWAARAARGWRFAVRDSGIGIELQFAGQLFGLFKRLARDRYPGTGIGLAICKKIVERHGGRIWVESEVRKGTTVIFTISDIKEEVS